MDEWTQGNAFDWAGDDEWSSKHNVDGCTSDIDMRVEPLPSQFLGYTNDIEPLLAHLLGYPDNSEAVPSQIPGCADNIEPLPSQLIGYTDHVGRVDTTSEAPPSRDLYGEGAVGHMAQPEYTLTQPHPSAATSTQSVKDWPLRSLLQAPVPPRQPQMSRAEAKMEEDIQLAEELISTWSTSHIGRGRGTEWSDNYACTVCRRMEEHYRQNPNSKERQMMIAIKEKLNIRHIFKVAFRSRIRRMIKKYLGLRYRMSDADQDDKEKEKLINKCPYIYHMHKALSYSKAYGGQSAAQLDSQLTHSLES